MYSYQEQHHQSENESTPSAGVPASVIVSSNSITAPVPAVPDSQLTDSWVGQSHSPPPGPSHMTAVVNQVEMPLHVKPRSLVAAAAATVLGHILPFPTTVLFSSALVIASMAIMQFLSSIITRLQHLCFSNIALLYVKA